MADPKTDANEEENKKKKEQEELNNAVLGGAAARSAAAGKMANPKDEEKPDEPGPKAPDPQDSSKKSLGAKVVEGLKKVLSSEGGTIYINIGGSGKKQEPDQKPAQPKAPNETSSSVKQPEVKATAEIESEVKNALKQTKAMEPDKDIPQQFYVGGNDPVKKSEAKATAEVESEVKNALKQTKAMEPDKDIPQQFYVGGNDPIKKSEPAPLVKAPPEIKLPDDKNAKLLASATAVAEAVKQMEKSIEPKAEVKQPEVKATAEIESEVKNALKQTKAMEPDKDIPQQFYVGGNDPIKKSEPAPLVKAPPEIKLPADNNKNLLNAAQSVANAVKQMGKSIEPKAEAPRIKLGSPKSPTGSTGNIITAVKGLTEQLKGLTEAISKPEAPKAPDQGRQKMQDVAKLEVDDVNDQVLLKANKQAKDGETPNPSSPRPGGPGR